MDLISSSKMELKRCKTAVVTKDEEEEMELKRCKTAVVVKESESESEPSSTWLSFLSVAPEDILVQILMRLPNSKQALQCKLVSKRWNSILSEPYFLHRAAAFHRHNYSGEGGSFTLIFQFQCRVFANSKPKKTPVFALEQPKGKENNGCVRQLYLDRLIGDLSSSSSSSSSELNIGASCDDLLLVEYKHKMKKNKYYVVNVQTHEWIALPPAPSIPDDEDADALLGTYFKVGLLCHYDYDRLSVAAFKVIRILYVCTNIVDIHQTLPMPGVDRTEFSVHIYSSDSKKWSEYTVDWYPFRLTHYLTKTPIISHNGMFHWVNGRALLSLNPFDLVFDDHDHNRVGVRAGAPLRLRLNRTVELPEKNFFNDPEIGIFHDFQCHGKVPKFLGIGVVRDHLRIITKHIDGDGGDRPLLVWQLDESKIGAADADGPWSLVYNVFISESPLKKISLSYDFVACHPYEGDVLFLQILNSIYQINLRTQILTKAKQVKPYKGNCNLSKVLPPLLHQWLPTQLPCLSSYSPL